MGSDESSGFTRKLKYDSLAQHFRIDHAESDVGVGPVLSSKMAKRALIEIICRVPKGEMALFWGRSCYFGVVADIFGELLPCLEGALDKGDQNLS